MARAVIFYWSSFKISPNPIAKCAQGCRRAPAHRGSLSKLSKSSITSLRFTEFFAPLRSDNSHFFFKWLFTKMAVSMVSDPESEQELAKSHLMLKNYCLCFSMSSSFVGNNPSLQIHSFSEDRGKCNKTCNASISDFATILTIDILILADSSHIPSDEAYRQCLSLPCNRLLTPCLRVQAQGATFFRQIFH